jgi:hypothetical protein
MSKHRASAAHPDRRAQFTEHHNPRRRTVAPVLIGAGVLFLSLIVLIVGRSSGGGPSHAAFADAAPAGADVVLDEATLDGQARFYRYATSSGREVRFFVMKSSDGVVRAAFDSCDVCYRERKGYHQSGDSMICNNCGQSFPSARINVQQGGCNPAPVDRVVANGRVVLSAAALERGASYF